TRLQALVDLDIAATVQLDAGFLEPDPGGIRRASRSDQDVAALDPLLTGGRADDKPDLLSGSAVDADGLGRHEELNTLLTQYPLQLSRDIGVLPAHELRSRLDDRHAAPKAAVSLGEFETDIATAEHDQVCRQVVEFQSLNVRERSGSLEARNARNRRVRP